MEYQPAWMTFELQQALSQLPTMRHRVMLDPAEEIEGGTTDDVLRRVLDTVEVPR